VRSRNACVCEAPASVARALRGRGRTSVIAAAAARRLATSDIDVHNTRTGTRYLATGVTWDATKWRATFALPSALPDGDFQATLAAANVTHATAVPLAADATLDFFVLAGDANRDRKVDLADFSVLATNFNRVGAAFSQGNFNYDGSADLLDFTVLATNFNKTLAVARQFRATGLSPPPPPPAATLAATAFSQAKSPGDIDLLASLVYA
jgi:hypothetical protein